ncbi:glycoside hydrolase family 114 protein, partial [Gonapodya prolifera JEL478]
VDLYDTTVAQISTLKLQGKIVICYFSAGSYENWRPDISAFPSSVIGKAMAGWAGEYWLDIRQLQILGPIMKNRMLLGVEKGCDGFDPDNVDEYTYTQKETNWPLNVTNQLAYNRLLADTAHSLGKLVALKNCQDLATTLLPWYDFAVVEQCAQYDECALSSPFINAGKAVFE